MVTDAPSFVLFGTDHAVVLVVTFVLALAMSRLSPGSRASSLARLMGVTLLTVAVLKLPLYIGFYDGPWRQNLPLDLCRINEFLCAYMLLRQSYRSFEITYFLSLAGSTSALLTPDLTYGFPDPRFLTFCFSHGLAVLGALCAVFGFGFRPTLRSLGVTVLFLGLYTLLMVPVNWLLDANYLFLRSKPEGASPLDLLGPWPYYVFGLMGMAVVACFFCYLPFAWNRTPRQPDR
ncbi:MAG: TIGR02206 family membrane protein [Pseudomonadales bacterium]